MRPIPGLRWPTPGWITPPSAWGSEPTTLSSPDELRRPWPRSLGLVPSAPVRVAMEGLSSEESAGFERRINRALSFCGCKVAAVVGPVAAGLAVAAQRPWQLSVPHPWFHAAGRGLAVFVIAVLVVKSVALVMARWRVRRICAEMLELTNKARKAGTFRPSSAVPDGDS